FITQLAFSSDGRHLVSADLDGLVQVWDLRRRKVIRTFIPPREKEIFSRRFALSPNGKLFAMERKSPAVRVWDIATGKEQGALEANGNSLNHLCFSPDAKTLAALGDNGNQITLYVWDMVNYKQVTHIRGDFGRGDQIRFSPDA